MLSCQVVLEISAITHESAQTANRLNNKNWVKNALKKIIEVSSANFECGKKYWLASKIVHTPTNQQTIENVTLRWGLNLNTLPSELLTQQTIKQYKKWTNNWAKIKNKIPGTTVMGKCRWLATKW